MLEVTPFAWIVTIGLVVGLLALDLALASLRPHAVGFSEATAWSVFYIAVAIVFGIVFTMQAGGEYGTQYFAGYIVEKSLSVDNLFVFVIIMTTFAVPEEHQHKVLTFGIVPALILRAIFIALGAALLSLFSFMFLLFGVLLIWTAVQLYRHRDEDPDVEDNVHGARDARVLPVTDDYVGGKVFTRVEWPTGGHAAVHCAGRHRQHRPAVRARFDPGGLRRDRGAVHRLRRQRLRPARLARAVLPRQGSAGPAGVPVDRARDHPCFHRGQAGAALGARHCRFDPRDRDPGLLAVIIVVLVVTTVASLIKVRRDPDARAHAGSLRGEPKRAEADSG